jgi:hypothetical protein
MIVPANRFKSLTKRDTSEFPMRVKTANDASHVISGRGILSEDPPNQCLDSRLEKGKLPKSDRQWSKLRANTIAMVRSQSHAETNLARSVLDFAVCLLGGASAIILCVAGILCSLAALVALSTENRTGFQRVSRIVGIVVVVFGFLVSFRVTSPGHYLSWGAPLLSIYWAVVLFHVLPKGEFWQGMSAILLNIIFWACNSANERYLSQIVCDFTIFVILPSVFTLVYLSRGFSLLEDRPHTGGPVIPLKKWLAKIAGLVSKLIPPCQ